MRSTHEYERATLRLLDLAPSEVYHRATYCSAAGALLPHHFTFTNQIGRILSIALSCANI